MAVKTFTGNHGSFFADGAEIIKIQGWTINGAVEILETTRIGENARKFIYGRNTWTGSCTGFYTTDSAGDLALAPMLDSTFMTAEFDRSILHSVRLALSPTRYFEANVLVESVAFEASAGGVAEVSIEFTVNGYPINTSIATA